MAYNGLVPNDTFHFDYLMAVRSALLLFVEEVVLVQCDLGCNMVDELKTPVVAAAEPGPAAEVELEPVAAFVGTGPLNSDDGFADTEPVSYFDDSVHMERYFGGSVDTELVNYLDAVTDKAPAIHSFDKVLVHCMNDTAVPNNLHNCYALEPELVHNNSHDYDWPPAVDWAECAIALVAEKMKIKLIKICKFQKKLEGANT